MTDIPSVLVVDQDDVFLSDTAQLLRDEGYMCDCVRSADEAREVISAKSYPLIIAETDMPGNEHLELIEGLPTSAGQTSVIVVTSKPSVETAVEALELPVRAYLTKPVNREDLLTKVRHGIAHSKLLTSVGRQAAQIQKWQREHRRLEQLIPQRTNESVTTYAKIFQSIMTHHIVESLHNLDLVTDIFFLSPKEEKARLVKLSLAMQETIRVLKMTKHSFRSKELGALRKRLERLLRDVGSGDRLT